MSGPRFLTPEAVARRLRRELGRRLDCRTIRRWCEEGIIPAQKVAGRWYIAARALDAWLDELEKRASAAIGGHARS